MTKISGIKAAWLENDGLGSLAVVGKSVVFKGNDGLQVKWSCSTEAEANSQLRLFRAALNHPASRNAA